MDDHMSMSLGRQRTLTILQHVHQTHHSSKGIKSRASPMAMSIISLLGQPFEGCVPGGEVTSRGSVFVVVVVVVLGVVVVVVLGVVVVVVLGVVVVVVLGVVVVVVSGVVGEVVVSGRGVEVSGTLCGRERSPCDQAQLAVLMVDAWRRTRRSLPRCLHWASTCSIIYLPRLTLLRDYSGVRDKCWFQDSGPLYLSPSSAPGRPRMLCDQSNRPPLLAS
jgi:hypothetical protein